VSATRRSATCRVHHQVEHARWLALMSPLRLDLGRRQDTPLCPTSVIVIYLVAILIPLGQFDLATRHTGLSESQHKSGSTSLHHGFNDSPAQAPSKQSVRHEEGQRQGPTSNRSKSPSPSLNEHTNHYRPVELVSKPPSQSFDKHSEYYGPAGLGSKPSTPSFDKHSNHDGSTGLGIRQQQSPFIKTRLS
jgi:hypothetical protein